MVPLRRANPCKGGVALKAGAPEISAQEVHDRLAADEPLVLVDVRDPEEVEAWPLAGSVHLPLAEVQAGRVDGLPRDREIVTVCALGDRSAKAAVLLQQRGLTTRSMRGGILAWSQVFDVASVRLAGGVEVVQFTRMAKGCLSYLVVADRHAAAIDVAARVAPYREAASARGVVITDVIDTHLHSDHLSGARRLAAETASRLYLNPVERFAFDGFVLVGDGNTVQIGSVVLQAMAAPGHTAGGLIWQMGDQALFTGDILFLESVGRPDLHGRAEPFARDLYATLQRVAALPEALSVWPGHAPAGDLRSFGAPHKETWGRLRRRLPLLAAPLEEFVARVTRVSVRPPNDEIILDMNRRGIDVPLDEAASLEAGPNNCAVA